MKQHAIIPIFIPHRGCPNDCVFCNQRSITARQDTVTPEDAKNTIETWLSTLEGRTPAIEVAFFGGSFTGIPMEEQTAFLQVAKAYKDAGRIHKIHLSTRPDYIDRAILTNLRRFDVDVIELGVQSFDDDVLRTSGRGHSAAVVYESSRLIREYGFTLGIQLMIGLPGDTLEKDLYSARETVKIGPALARLYPTVILKDTALYQMYLSGTYQPMDQKDAVYRTKEMYKILDAAGIQIIRVGLKSSDLITDRDAGATPAAEGHASKAGRQVAAGTFHPAFRQLVEGEIARESLEAQIHALFPDLCQTEAATPLQADSHAEAPISPHADGQTGPAVSLRADGHTEAAGYRQADGHAEAAGYRQADSHAEAPGTGGSAHPCPTVLFVSNQKDRNNLFGHKGCNRTYFADRYPWLSIRYVTDRDAGRKLPPGRYLVLPSSPVLPSNQG